MPALFSRLLDKVRRAPSIPGRPAPEPVQFGPRYSLSGERLTIESGPLAGLALRIERNVTATKADFAFHEADAGRPAGDPLAHCHFDRNPDSGIETFWEVFIRAEFRQKGLTSLLTRVSLRELLASGHRHWLAIRKLMHVDSEAERHHLPSAGTAKPEIRSPSSPRISLHNIGIGMVALKLGFRPEPDIEWMLAPGNVRSVQALDAAPPIPPGLLLRIGTQPGLLVAAVMDPDTGRPLADAEAYERFVSPRQLLRRALSGQAVIGNIDYVLSRAGIEQLAARLADDRAELKRFISTLRRGAKN